MSRHRISCKPDGMEVIYQQALVYRCRADISPEKDSSRTCLVDFWRSEPGRWVLERALEQPEIIWEYSVQYFEYEIGILAWLPDSDITFYNLRWKIYHDPTFIR